MALTIITLLGLVPSCRKQTAKEDEFQDIPVEYRKYFYIPEGARGDWLKPRQTRMAVRLQFDTPVTLGDYCQGMFRYYQNQSWRPLKYDLNDCLFASGGLWEEGRQKLWNGRQWWINEQGEAVCCDEEEHTFSGKRVFNVSCNYYSKTSIEPILAYYRGIRGDNDYALTPEIYARLKKEGYYKFYEAEYTNGTCVWDKMFVKPEHILLFQEDKKALGLE